MGHKNEINNNFLRDSSLMTKIKLKILKKSMKIAKKNSYKCDNYAPETQKWCFQSKLWTADYK